MKHTQFALTAFVILGFALTTTAQIGTLPKLKTTRTIVAGTPNKMPSMQDTLSMLMNRIKSLEYQVSGLEQNSLPGGKKTLVTIVPDANNFCFPYKDSRFPNNEYYQGVIIDNAICNNNPEAVIIVTVKTKRAGIVPHAVLYDVADGKWKISVQGYFIGSLAKNVSCYNHNGADQTMCPASGLWQDVAVSSPSEISPYDTEANGSALVFNVLISEHKEYKAPKIGQKY